MMSRKKNALETFIIVMLIIGGAVAGYILCFIISGIIYPEHDDHTEPATSNFLFRLFFDYNSTTGYHPQPSAFSIVSFSIAGLIIGLAMARMVIQDRLKTKKIL